MLTSSINFMNFSQHEGRFLFAHISSTQLLLPALVDSLSLFLYRSIVLPSQPISWALSRVPLICSSGIRWNDCSFRRSDEQKCEWKKKESKWMKKYIHRMNANPQRCCCWWWLYRCAYCSFERYWHIVLHPPTMALAWCKRQTQRTAHLL